MEQKKLFDISKGATSQSLNQCSLIPWSEATAQIIILVAPNLFVYQDLSQKMRNLYEFFHRVPLNEKNSKGHRFKAEVKMYNLYFAEIFYIGKL